MFSPQRARLTFVAEIRQKEKKPRKSFLARIEQLIDKILFNSDVPDAR
jgi:hypothetical protein